MNFAGLAGAGVALILLASVFWLTRRSLPQAGTRPPAGQSLLRRYAAFEAEENGLLAIPFFVIGAIALAIGAIGLLVT